MLKVGAGHLNCLDSKGESRTNYTATFGWGSTRHADTLPQISRARAGRVSKKRATKGEYLAHVPFIVQERIHPPWILVFFTSYCCVRSPEIFQIQFEYGQVNNYGILLTLSGRAIIFVDFATRTRSRKLSSHFFSFSLSLPLGTNISIDFTFYKSKQAFLKALPRVSVELSIVTWWCCEKARRGSCLRFSN